MPNKINSNSTGLNFAEEVANVPKTLAGSPVWYELEPNTYSDFGGDFKLVARDPINAARSRKKGSITDLDTAGGWNEDLTATNMPRLLQSFFFAAAREKPKTQPLNGTQVPITSVDSGTKQFRAASGLGVFIAKLLVWAEGFGISANNGLKTVTASAAGQVTVAEALTDEASPPAGAKLTVVGVEFATADATLTATAANLTLGTTAFNLTTLGLLPGELVFIGGDAAGAQFVGGTNKPGYGRVYSVAASALVLDKTTWTPATDAGTGKKVHVYFMSSVLRNETDPTLIVARSQQLERGLGNDGSGIQSELLLGAFGNELTFNIPKSDKLTLDLKYVALDYETRTGTQGLKTGTRIAALGEDAFNTSRDVWRIRMAVLDPATLNPTPYFGYINEAKITINNKVQVSKAVSVLGGFDISPGNFEAGGNVDAYFTTVAAIAAIKSNADVTTDAILAKKNRGIAIDFPLHGLGGGRLKVEKDQAIMLPLDTPAYQSAFGHTLLMGWFHYLPTVAMPA
jgi:hypothetical protein